MKKDLEVSPENAFTQLIKMEGPFELTDLYTEMINMETGEILVSYQPVKIQKAEKPSGDRKEPSSSRRY